MNGWFDKKGFTNYYLAKSKYARKNELINSFYTAWIDVTNRGIDLIQDFTGTVNKIWNAPTKKAIKVLLISWGYSPASIEGLFKSFSDWNKHAPK